MKWIFAAACLLVAVTSIYSAGQLDEVPVPPPPLARAFGLAKAEALGVAKLTEDEQMQWLALLRAVAGSGGGTLEASAASFMKNNGWEEVVYVGDAKKEFKTYSIFTFGILGESYAVESPLMLRLSPGKYFGKISILGDGLESIVDGSGREHRFLLDKWIKVGR
jgi:hypothetical protein